MLIDDKLATRYLEWLFLELESYDPKELETIYVGGGTPSALNETHLKILLQKLAPLLAEGGEFSVEANVESLTNTKLSIMKSYGVNRLSIGVQSFQPRLLKHMNRHHDQHQILEAINSAKALGFTNISIDLILDLPTQSRRDIVADVNQALALNVPHISTYSLSVHPGTVYGKIGRAHV
jgi:oxygen-independent coproporphyrinogen-3 oxidase